mmetsp:Transcript_7228/g.12343  ORF Transcript_7228/g.12343 Transcript_7228/m.12343 type:complete len:97 (-) Transcript_7228:130-420(-)
MIQRANNLKVGDIRRAVRVQYMTPELAVRIIWRRAEPTTTNMKNPRTIGPTVRPLDFFASQLLVEAAPLFVIFELYFSDFCLSFRDSISGAKVKRC